MPYLFAIIVIASAAYIAWRLATIKPEAGTRAGAPSRPEAPRGPDDDPEFLRSLEK